MDAQRKNRYLDKLSSLKKYYNLLQKWADLSNIEELSKNQNYQLIFAIYHSFQLTLEIIIDISAMIIKDLKYKAGDNYFNYEILFQEEIITSDLYNVLKELTGLRNRIVHDYNGIIDKLAWDAITNNLIMIPKFMEAIELWLEKESSNK